MLEDAINLPRRGDDWLPTILVGGLLLLTSFLIVPAIILQGYLVRVLEVGLEEGETPPSFIEWGDLLVDGLKLVVVNVLYSLVVVVPMIVFVAGFVLIASVSAPVPTDGGVPTPPPGPSGPGIVGIVLFVGLFAVVLVGTLLLAYLLPAAMANFAREGRLGAAFALRTISSGAFTSDYAVAWVLAIVVGFVVGLVGSLLSLVIVGIFVLFYGQVVTYYLFGRGFAAGLAKKQGGGFGESGGFDPAA